MFKLLKLSVGNYRVYNSWAGVDTEVSEENLPETMAALGVSERELRIALDAMYVNDHNCSDFGISLTEKGRCGFIFSDNRVVKSKTSTTTEVVFEPQKVGNA